MANASTHWAQRMGGAMTILGKACAAFLLAAFLAAPVTASTVNVYTVGSNPAGNALDPFNVPVGGVPIVSWTDMFVGVPAGSVFLSILAEGVDGGPNAPGGGEFDGVYVNGTFVGFLTQQPFYSPLFNLRPGPGALAGITGLTVSVFEISALLVNGLNSFEVRVDPGNWVNEIEIARLFVPEPDTLAMLGLGVGTLGLVLWRRRRTH